ncbi:tyrosine aminotransferase [Trypanosoma theileri]|uniref:Tyrosine aminotransferase n=1 Tax=Trypanosoma theileri TaxID=67003 RepID=A0A1X0P7X4_9TRYP|nr:tyrosine aminotransferase [Trypanosoma theileri]ORC92931.1 tyrosine aminotransferase [Trypanosoma theileri]
MTAWTVLEPSLMTQRAVNRIESVSYRVSRAPPEKTQLKLSIGDPTYDGNLVAPTTATEAFVRGVESNKYNGYQQSFGRPEAREAVAQFWGKNFAGEQASLCKAENVVLTCGVSEALLTIITSLCDEGDNILLPMPGFPLYDFICDLYKFEGRHYLCNVEKDWEIDFNHVRSLVDDKTKAILITNPSNPCGSNFGREHIKDIIQLCEELQLPLIADEIYAGLVFPGDSFISVAEFQTSIPRFILGGLSKTFMIPGWRFGWIILMDPDNYAKEVLQGMRNLSTISLGPNSVVQGVVSEILANTPESYFKRNIEEICNNATLFSNAIPQCHGLSCASPRGGMFIMVKIDLNAFSDVKDDIAFYEMLEDEENVQVIPGIFFHMPGYFRVVISRPKHIVEEVTRRLREFCTRHKKN